MVTRVGLVSDTHGRYDERLTPLFARCDHIVHAGDVVGHEILTLLSSLAPVTAVRGNCDEGGFGEGLAAEAVLELEQLRLLVLHDLGRPDRPNKIARGLLERHRPSVVVHGHSHMPSARVLDGVLYVNPGSAGPRRFELPRAAGMLIVEERRVRVELVDLDREPPALLVPALEVGL